MAKSARMKRFPLPIFCLLLMALAGSAQELEMRIFQLNNRPAEATVEMVRPLLSPEGTVLPETRLQKLIVRDSAEKLAEIESFLNEIDQPAPQVRIHVAMQGVSPLSGHEVGVGVSGNLHHPNVTLAAQSSSGVSSVNSQQNLLVMSGEHGVITMGRDLVSVDPYYRFALDCGLLPSNLVMHTVSTGFAVSPVVVGDVVRMTITPWLGFVGPDGRAEVMVDQASTTVALKSGQTATIASSAGLEELRGQAYGLIFGSASLSRERNASITVQPEILENYSNP